jgi:hypothetical protein
MAGETAAADQTPNAHPLGRGDGRPEGLTLSMPPARVRLPDPAPPFGQVTIQKTAGGGRGVKILKDEGRVDRDERMSSVRGLGRLFRFGDPASAFP